MCIRFFLLYLKLNDGARCCSANCHHSLFSTLNSSNDTSLVVDVQNMVLLLRCSRIGASPPTNRVHWGYWVMNILVSASTSCVCMHSCHQWKHVFPGLIQTGRVCPCKSSCFECRHLFLMMQNLANTAWAFAKLGFFDSKLFDALSSQALTVAPQLERQDLSHVTWAVCHAYTAQAAAQGIGKIHPIVAPAYLNMLILSSNCCRMCCM